MKDRGFPPWSQLRFYFYSPLTCEISFTSEKELLPLSISMAFAADAPGTKRVVKTLFNAVYIKSSFIHKLKILIN